MNVLHVISSGGMYGAEAVILNLSHELNGSKLHHSSLAVFSHAGLPAPVLHEVASQAGVGSELVPCAGQADFAVAGRLRALATRLGVDVVHAHGYKADLYTYVAFRGRKQRPALVSTCHTWYDNDLAVRVYGALDRWVLRSFDQVIAVSEDVRRRLLGAGVRKQKITLIENGIQVDCFAAAASERNAQPAGGKSLRVGLVGRLAPEKGVDLFLRAVAQIADRFPTTQFVVAGDGPDRASLEVLLGELGLQNRAALVGRQADMPRFLASLDLLVSASRHEGLPIALLEGMASGLPILATRVGAIERIVSNGKTGLLVAPEDSGALADGIARLLDRAEEREAMGVAALQRVQEHFSARRMMNDNLAVYEAALQKRGMA